MLLFAFSLTAHAAGFYTTTSGTKALGRGGAYTATVDDLSAQFHNPAGLVRLDGPEIMFNLTAVEATASFERTGYAVIEDSGAPFPIPSIGAATRFGTENTVFAIGFYPPYAPDLLFPETGAQRYSLVDSIEWQAYGGPTVAHRFASWLSVGVGLQWTFLRAEREFDLSTCDPVINCDTDESDRVHDIHASLTSFDPATFSANLGVLLQPTQALSIGLFVEPPINYEATASISTEIPQNHAFSTFLDGSKFTDDDVQLQVKFPLILRAGIGYAFSETFDLELTGGFQGWSRNEEIRVTGLDMTIPLTDSGQNLTGIEELQVTDDVVIKTNYVDSWSVHLGGGWAVSDPLELRMGAFYEKSAIPLKYLNVSTLDADKVGVGLGASYRFEKVSFDLGLARNQFLIPEVTESESYKIVLDPFAAPGEQAIYEGIPVGGGTYKAATTLASLGATYHF